MEVSEMIRTAAEIAGLAFAYFKGHRSLRSEVRELRGIVVAICDRLGVEVKSGPHLIAAKALK